MRSRLVRVAAPGIMTTKAFCGNWYNSSVPGLTAAHTPCAYHRLAPECGIWCASRRHFCVFSPLFCLAWASRPSLRSRRTPPRFPPQRCASSFRHQARFPPPLLTILAYRLRFPPLPVDSFSYPKRFPPLRTLFRGHRTIAEKSLKQRVAYLRHQHIATGVLSSFEPLLSRLFHLLGFAAARTHYEIPQHTRRQHKHEKCCGVGEIHRKKC